MGLPDVDPCSIEPLSGVSLAFPISEAITVASHYSVIGGISGIKYAAQAL